MLRLVGVGWWGESLTVRLAAFAVFPKITAVFLH